MPIGSKVSRWTMLHFGVAIGALLIAEVLLVTGYADPLAALRAPATLVGVHLITIGWLSLLMLGALYQFVPVITNTTLYSQRLPLYSIAAILPGLAVMLAGFMALGATRFCTPSACRSAAPWCWPALRWAPSTSPSRSGGPAPCRCRPTSWRSAWSSCC